jgi:soluble lytic murein transglycosylase
MMRNVLLITFFCLATCFAANAGLADSPSLQDQREAFVRALHAAERGDWSRVEPELPVLESYPLRDDLRGAWLAASIADVPHPEIEAYLEHHPSLYASSRLRSRWIQRLYTEQRWSEFLDQYQGFYANGSDAALHCQAVLARLKTGESTTQIEPALKLWTVGHSQPKQCDPLFRWLAGEKVLDSARYRKRLSLALAERNFQLADYLAGSLTESEQALADLYKRIASDPGRELAKQHFKNSERARSLILDGLERLARRDPDAAQKLWKKKYRKHFSFSDAQRAGMERKIAFWSAQNMQPNSMQRMARLPVDFHDEDSLEWWARAALYLGDWPSVSRAIAAMPDKLAREDVWQYWGARAMQNAGKNDQATQALMALAQQRSYYGFMAADTLGLPYAFSHRNTPADELLLEELAGKQELFRAGELFATGLYTRGRQEWDEVIRKLSPTEQIQASILAHRMGWHSRAIATAARQRLYDDLELRYPPAFFELFKTSSDQAGISVNWAMGIARSESLFMPDVKSRAGALGLMQLMPATGAATAREFQIRYTSSGSLLDPDTNIQLGTRYLEKMQARFGSHQVLSTAAYNAGPNRVSSWLPATGSVPADIWIETLPYRETRNYVRRVLESQAIFSWRLERQGTRLSDVLTPIPSAAQLQARLLVQPRGESGSH